MKLMFAIAFLGLGIVGLTADATPDSLLDPLSKLTATGAMTAVVFWLLAKTIPSMNSERREDTAEHRETMRNLTDKMNHWEDQRTKDSRELNETLRQMIANCAAVNRNSSHNQGQ